MNQFLASFFALFMTIISFLGIPCNKSSSSLIDLQNGGDPYIIEDSGKTYYTFTTGGGIEIRQIAAFNNTETIAQKTVFRAGSCGTVKDIWAPEIHRIDNKWYIISCAVFDKDTVSKGLMPENTDSSEHDDFYRYAFVLESKTEDIFGEYEFKGILAPGGMNNIDGTYLKKDGKLYFVTSSYKNIGHQCITVSEMENPYTLKTDNNGNTVTTQLSEPEYSWETKGWKVNEGPAVLYFNDEIFIVYSASGFSSGYYSMGMLTFTGNDIMNPCHWYKSPVRIHYNRPHNDIYNAGHCSFLYRDDGSIYMVFHATSTEDFYQSPRLTHIKEIKFYNNTPFFG